MSVLVFVFSSSPVALPFVIIVKVFVAVDKTVVTVFFELTRSTPRSRS